MRVLRDAISQGTDDMISYILDKGDNGIVPWNLAEVVTAAPMCSQLLHIMKDPSFQQPQYVGGLVEKAMTAGLCPIVSILLGEPVDSLEGFSVLVDGLANGTQLAARNAQAIIDKGLGNIPHSLLLCIIANPWLKVDIELVKGPRTEKQLQRFLASALPVKVHSTAPLGALRPAVTESWLWDLWAALPEAFDKGDRFEDLVSHLPWMYRMLKLHPEVLPKTADFNLLAQLFGPPKVTYEPAGPLVKLVNAYSASFIVSHPSAGLEATPIMLENVLFRFPSLERVRPARIRSFFAVASHPIS